MTYEDAREILQRSLLLQESEIEPTMEAIAVVARYHPKVKQALDRHIQSVCEGTDE